MNQRHLLNSFVRRLLWAVAIGGANFTVIDSRADSVVIPAIYADTEATSRMAEGSSFAFRQHYLFYSFEFPPGPIDITGFRFRPKASTGSYSAVYRDLKISLTVTRETALANGFDDNLDAALQPVTTVIEGDTVVQTVRVQPPRNPKNFDYEFLWETPFRYDPADGVNLLIDFDTAGYDRSPLLDAAKIILLPEPARQYRRRHLVQYFECPNTCIWPDFPVTEFIYTPVLDDPPQAGDFNNDHVLDITDIVSLTEHVAEMSKDLAFDVTGDGGVDQADIEYWVHELFGTWMGDANLDGLFDSTDMVAVLSAGEYEDALVGNSTWSTGDWDGNGDFDSSDLIAALSDGGYEAGPRAGVSAVPEPAGWFLLLPVVGTLARTHARTRVRRRKPQ